VLTYCSSGDWRRKAFIAAMGIRRDQENRNLSLSMGKKDKDKEKQAAKKAAKALQQSLKTQKSAKKKMLNEVDEEDVEVVLAQIQAEEAKKTAVTISTVDRPIPRANFTLTPLPSGELIVLFGEFYDGQVNRCFNETYRFNPATNEWKLFVSPNTPAPRCSHQAVLLNNKEILIFGGEYATVHQFYHYQDTFKLDLSTHKWTRIESKKNPSARSGHRMVLWRHLVILFGGFHQSYTSDKWFNDLWFFDTRTNQWSEVTFPGTTMLPAARSGHSLLAIPGKDALLLYGGYSELRATVQSDSIVPQKAQKGQSGSSKAALANASLLSAKKTKSVTHQDVWLLKLSPLVGGSSNNATSTALPVWERIRCVGSAPSPRLGFSMAMFRDRAILFGGVSDQETDSRGETIESTFYNDMFSLDLERKRWFKLEMKKQKAVGSRRAKKKPKMSSSAKLGDDEDDVELSSSEDEAENEEENADIHGGGIEDGAFYYYQDGKLVRIEQDEEEDEEGEKKPEGTTSEVDGLRDEASQLKLEEKTVDSQPVPETDASKPEVDAGMSIEAAKANAVTLGPSPSARMKASMFTTGHNLFVFGGLNETATREVTLNDLWKLDLRDRSKWQELLPATEHVWKGDESDDDDDEDDGSSDGSESDEDGSSNDDDEDAASSSEEEEKTKAKPMASARGKSRIGMEKILQLRDQLSIEDSRITPAPGEVLGHFWTRTSTYWITEYATHHLRPGERVEGKKLRTAAFKLARLRYDAIWPILVQIHELEEEQMQAEALAAAEKKGKKRRG
jgi:Domain of unknown function (DUF4110)/Kelch motif/Galactose oxidase, central domain